ncbi:MAG: LamG-like jellyroll fold domain-containing protein [Pseudomonadota bacterium]
MTQITSTELGASGRYVTLGSPASHDNLTNQTLIVYAKPNSASATLGYIFSKANSSGSGPRMQFNESTRTFGFGSGSTGSATTPLKTSATALWTNDTWHWFQATWNGSLNATTGINLYFDAGTALTGTSDSAGTGSIIDDSANDVTLLNRVDQIRPFVGDVAYVARWNRILSDAERTSVRAGGPLLVPSGLVLCFANGIDYSPEALSVTGRSTRVTGATPPNTTLGPLNPTVGAVSFIGYTPSVSTGSATIAPTAGAITVTGYTPSVTQGAAIAPAAGAVSVAGFTPSVSQPRTVAPTAGAVTVTGYTPTVSQGLALTVIAAVDAGNVDPTLVDITDATSTTPTVYLDTRSATGAWRHFFFAVENAAGKTPIFQFNRATRTSPVTPDADWLPLYTTTPEDHTSWVRAPARTLVGGSSGYIEWQFTAPLPSGRVYIASQPLGRQEDCETFAADLLADYPSIASPGSTADSAGVFNTTGSYTDDLGREAGLNPMHAITLAWGGATTDGGPKRKLVVCAHTHAAGEATSWIPFRYFCDWMLDSASAEAVAFRANFNVYLYFALIPDGLFSGERREDAGGSTDPNRVWVLTGSSTIPEITATRAAIEADTGGACDVFLSWHSFSTEDYLWITAASPTDADVLTRRPSYQRFLELGEEVFGIPPYEGGTYTSGTFNTDSWWGEAKLGARVSTDCEVQQNGSTALATYQYIGESWAKSVQAADADGMFYAAPVQPSAGAVTWTGYTPEVFQTAGIRPQAGAVTVTGFQPSVSQPRSVAPSAGAVTWNGYTPTISNARVVQPASGAVAVAGYAPTISQPRTLTASPGAIAWAGYTPSVSQEAIVYVRSPGGSGYVGRGITTGRPSQIARSRPADYNPQR